MQISRDYKDDLVLVSLVFFGEGNRLTLKLNSMTVSPCLFFILLKIVHYAPILNIYFFIQNSMSFIY